MMTSAWLTKGNIEPTSQQLQQPGKALEQGQFELVVVRQVDQNGAKGQLQKALGHLVVADHMGQALLSCHNDGLIWAGQVFEEHLDDLLAQLRELSTISHLNGTLTVPTRDRV